MIVGDIVKSQPPVSPLGSSAGDRMTGRPGPRANTDDAASGRVAGTDYTLLLLIPGLMVVIGLFVYPFFYGLVLSFEPQGAGKGVFDNYIEFFSKPRLYDTIAVTLWISLPATLINVGAAVPIAFQLRRKSTFQRLLTAVLVVPITLGTVLVAEGLLGYLGPQGWFNRVLMLIHVIDAPVRLTHNYWGVMLSLVITGFPFAFLLILSYITGIDPNLARAAATLGAGPWAQFRTIYLPLLAPGLAVAFSLSFVQAFSVFPSAVLLGAPAGPTRVISIAAYQAAFEDYDYSMASTIAMIMGVVQLAVVAVVLASRGLLYRGPVAGGKG
jgi:putative spermidine/putrescine transport system permease protein